MGKFSQGSYIRKNSQGGPVTCRMKPLGHLKNFYNLHGRPAINFSL